MAAWRYSIYLLVLKNISQVCCTHSRNIFQHEDKCRFSMGPCNILYTIVGQNASPVLTVMQGSILPVTIPPPLGTPPGICNFFLTWRSIPHPRARSKRQFPTPGTPHRPQIRCFVFKIDLYTIAQPDILTRTSTFF